MDYIPIRTKKGEYGQISKPDKNSPNLYISRLSIAAGNIDPQIIDGVIDLFNLCCNITGEFLLVFNDFINKILQFINQID